MSMAATKDYFTAIERDGYERYKETAHLRVNVPLGKSGPWVVRKFVTHFDLQYMRFVRDGRAPGLGEFTALSHAKHGVVMSDTVPEINDLMHYVRDLRGDVLVTGLGLGMVAHILTKVKPYSKVVTSLTIVEKDKHVIKLTGEFYRKSDPRIKIVHADALEWTPPKGTKFDAAWHDIWLDMSERHLPEVAQLRKHYQRYVGKRQQFYWGQATLQGRHR